MAILITAGAEAVAYRLERSIAYAHDVYFADYFPLPAKETGRWKFIKIPEGRQPTYIHEMLTTCINLQIHTVYPLCLHELVQLSESRQLFTEYGIEVVVPEKPVLQKLLSDRSMPEGELLVIKNKLPVNQTALKISLHDIENGIFTVNPSSGQYVVFFVRPD